MSMYNYGIGGNEVKKDASEAISNIPSNRTLLIQKLTNEPPVTPEAVYNLETVEQVLFAKKIGAKAMQGYYFTKPLSLVDLMEYLQAEQASTLIDVTELAEE